MAKGVNKVILVGHLGKDPEVKYTPGGAAVASFSLATNKSWKDKTGALQEKTEWHKLVAWNKTAEIIGEYLKKGALIYVEGELQTRNWDKDGQKHYMTEVVVREVQFLDRKGETGSGAREDAPLPSEDSAPPPAIGKDDLPF